MSFGNNIYNILKFKFTQLHPGICVFANLKINLTTAELPMELSLWKGRFIVKVVIAIKLAFSVMAVSHYNWHQVASSTYNHTISIIEKESGWVKKWKFAHTDKIW